MCYHIGGINNPDFQKELLLLHNGTERITLPAKITLTSDPIGFTNLLGHLVTSSALAVNSV